jgi:hypothetical protein
VKIIGQTLIPPNTLWKMSWFLTSKLKLSYWNYIYIKNCFWWLDCWSGHKSQEFFDCIKEKHPNMLVVFVPTNYIRMFSNQLMLFCSTHSSMHSKWCSTISQLESSNNKLEMAKIPMLISKWAIWNHRFVSGQTMHGKN